MSSRFHRIDRRPNSIGGGITPWFAYVLALAFLYIRPAGLFGERAIERV